MVFVNFTTPSQYYYQLGQYLARWYQAHTPAMQFSEKV